MKKHLFAYACLLTVLSAGATGTVSPGTEAYPLVYYSVEHNVQKMIP